MKLKKLCGISHDGEYYFKKAHAIAFATAIVVQLNLICESANDFN